MPDNRQKPISLRSNDKDILDEHKKRYEASTGKPTDWNGFLNTVTLLGLAAAGIYALAKVHGRSHQSVDVQCPSCDRVFLMAVAVDAERVIYTTCPYCRTELVIDLGTSL